MATMSYLPCEMRRIFNWGVSYIPWDEMTSCSWHQKFFLEDYFRPSKGRSKREKGVRIKSFRCINNRLPWSDPHFDHVVRFQYFAV